MEKSHTWCLKVCIVEIKTNKLENSLFDIILFFIHKQWQQHWNLITRVKF